MARFTGRRSADGGWDGALTRLRKLGLIAKEAAAGSKATGGLDAHPLVREHFADDLPKEAARAGHERLYRHLCAKPAKDLPDTLAEMQPLYLAIPHGVKAGFAQKTYDEVYRRRIRRDNEAYSIKKLGAFGPELAALAAFFEQPWSRPLPELAAGDRAFLLNQAGFCLRALGRLTETIDAYRAGLEMIIQQQHRKNAAIQASNLSELLVTIGRVAEAVDAGRQAVDLAERSGDAGQRMVNRTTLADALHQRGEGAAAEKLFQEAETIQAEWQPTFPLLSSLRGFQYCDLLLSQGQPEAVQRRAAQTLEWAEQVGAALLTIALDHLSLGRAAAALGDEATSTSALDSAVERLRNAGEQHRLPHGLLARAAFRREKKQWEKARKDLAEVRRIASRGGMALNLIDLDLEEQRLRRDQGLAPEPDALARISAAIKETGYHRRDADLAELQAG